MLGRRIGLMAVAAAMGLGAMAPGFTQPAPMVTTNTPRKAKKGLFGGIALQPKAAWSYPRKDRMNTAAQHKRASIKARNRAKHRRTA